MVFLVALSGAAFFLARPGQTLPGSPIEARGDEQPSVDAPAQQPAAQEQPPPPAHKTDKSADAFARLNAARQAAGLAPVALDPDTRGQTLILRTPTVADIDELLAEPPSRLRLLDLDLARVNLGAGLVLGVAPPGQTSIILYPADGQKDVPPGFPGNEVPDPVPLAKDKVAGYPLTVTFPAGTRLRQATGRLLDADGQEVPAWFSSPETPANPQFKNYQGTTLCIIAKDLLQYGATYKVEMSANSNGQAWSRRWTFSTLSREKESEGLVPRVLAEVNVARRAAGLESLALDEELTKACHAHARYIARNAARSGLDLNDEDPKLPGATKEGRRVAKIAHVSTAPFDPTWLVDGWLASFHYRLPLLDREARKIGIGGARGPRDWYSVVVLGDPGPPPAQPLLYPGDGQAGVMLEYESGEMPDPIPESKDRRAGFPISLIYPPKARVREVKAELRLDGMEVPFWLSMPERPVAEGMQYNSVCLIARRPFKPESRYEVKVTAKVDGKPFEKAWSFRTRSDSEAGQVKVAAEAVARVNQYRRLAGLSPIVLDAELSRGCRLHARYLLTNLDHPSTRGLGMHDEDAKLPGYTPEGKKAGADSVIAGGMPPLPSIDDWMATFYHRIPLLDPELGRIGFGHVRGGPVGWFAVLNATGGKGRDATIVYPGEGQKDVPLKGKDGTGYPLTVAFPAGQKLRSPAAVLRDGNGKEVSVKLAMLASALVVTPVEPLKPGTSYTMIVKGMLSAKAWTRTWKFSTSSE